MPKTSLVNFLQTRGVQHVPAFRLHVFFESIRREGPDKSSALSKSKHRLWGSQDTTQRAFLQPSAFFLEMLTFFSTRKFASSILRGGKHSKNQKTITVLRSRTKSSQCADLVLRSHTKSSQCANLKYLRSASECPVCDLVLCDLLCE